MPELDYTIVIPAFNKAALTRQCLLTLRQTLVGAGEGEVLVVDNASSDETPAMLAEFPWARAIRNEVNRGFAGANNQAARAARGRFLVLLNNDTVARPGWLTAMLRTAAQPGVGAVGARLLFPDGRIQHAGVMIEASPFGLARFVPLHDLYLAPGEDPSARVRADLQVVTAACFVTPRKLYLDLGGLDEGFWNGYEDVDYCLKVRARGLRVVYEPEAVLTHFESQSGTQRFRRVAANVERLARRWNGRVEYDEVARALRRGEVRRRLRASNGILTSELVPVPTTTVLVHGARDGFDAAACERMLRANAAPIDRILFAGAGEEIELARRHMERRGDRYLAFVEAGSELREGWLDELVRQIEFGWNVAAATAAPELPPGDDGSPTFAADARCTLLALRHFPMHERLGDFPTLHGAVADYLIRAAGLRLGTRGGARPLGTFPDPCDDPQFERVHGLRLREVLSDDIALTERALRSRVPRARGLVSIVMLSWNAPEFTKLALESIRAYTSHPYEVIVVDNGSARETTDWLRTLEDVRVIYNASNRGYAGGNNQALAAARGEYVVLLNNDVVVTEGWLDGLLGAFDRIPGLGVCAPRSNRVVGHQLVVDVEYQGLAEMHRYAAERRERYRRTGYVADRAIGLCLCVDRRTIGEIGGIDERFGVGNFEDDDFCIRVRAAGYRIYVCNDVFIHHFGSRTFAANKIDYAATMRENWHRFTSKWNLPAANPAHGYSARQAILGGFDRPAHYFALPADANAASYRIVFLAAPSSEAEWEEIGAFLRRYVRAYAGVRDVLCAIAAGGELSAQALGSRVERTIARTGIPTEQTPDVEISDAGDIEAWLASLPSVRRMRIGEPAQAALLALEPVADASPSALRRLLEPLAPA